VSNFVNIEFTIYLLYIQCIYRFSSSRTHRSNNDRLNMSIGLRTSQKLKACLVSKGIFSFFTMLQSQKYTSGSKNTQALHSHTMACLFRSPVNTNQNSLYNFWCYDNFNKSNKNTTAQLYYYKLLKSVNNKT